MNLIPTSNTLTPYEQKQWKEYFSTWFDNLSPHTAQAYANDWRGFWDFCPKHPSDISTRDIQGYVNALEVGGWQETTIARKLYSMSSFYNFAKEKGIRLDNPCEDVRKPKIDAYIRAKWISFEQAKELLAMLRADETFRGKRDFALCIMLLTTANRRMSIASFERGQNYYMRLDQLRSGGGTYVLTYPLKGGGSREVTLAPEVSNALDRYFEVRPMNSDAVFCHWDGSPLLVHDINKIVKEWGKRFGVDLTPHMLRHTATRAALKTNQFTMNEIKDMTGHASMRTLLIYLEELEKEGQEKIGMSLAYRLINEPIQEKGKAQWEYTPEELAKIRKGIDE